MPKRTATVYIDYQQRASEFSVGDAVTPFGSDSIVSGRVVAVYPAIGMVDVEFANGNKRFPVEDLQRIRQDSPVNEPLHDSVPGGAGTVEVPGGPDPKRDSPDRPQPTFTVDDTEENLEREKRRTARIQSHLGARVARAWVKRALYWGDTDRKYRAKKTELASGDFSCPKCGQDHLRKAIYKRTEGASERLMGCPSCMFLIKRCDIMGIGD